MHYHALIGKQIVSGNNEVELKGGMYTFMSLRLHTTDLSIIDKRVADKVQQAPAFFKDTPVVVDLTQLEESVENEHDFDTKALLETIRSHKLVPIVVSVTNKSSPIASSIALPLIESGARRQTNTNNASEDKPTSSGEASATSLISGQTADQQAHSSAEEAELDLAHAGSEVQMVIKAPMLISRPVRSGQQVYARDTDLIIMGPVGPGAEVIADNNIHVYGPLRGRALCGVSGNSETRIFCQSLEAELVSVAGNYRVLEEIPADLRGKPAQIWLDNDRLNIEPL